MSRMAYCLARIRRVTGQPQTLRYLGILTTFTALLAWWLVTDRGLIKPLYLPSPAEVIAAARAIGLAELLRHIGWTLLRVVGGFAGGVSLGLAAGFAMTYDARISAMLHPIVEAWRPVPAVAIIPFFVLWFGFSVWGQILLIALGCSLVITVATVEASRHVNPIFIRAALSLGASRRRLLWSVTRPAIIPELTSALRVALALSISLCIVGEYMGALYGVGYLINNAARASFTQGLVLYTVILGCLSFSLDALLRRLMSFLTRWAERSEEAIEASYPVDAYPTGEEGRRGGKGDLNEP